MIFGATPDDVFALLQRNGESFWRVHMANFWMHVLTLGVVLFLAWKFLRIAKRSERILKMAELHGEISDGRRESHRRRITDRVLMGVEADKTELERAKGVPQATPGGPL